jgi:serine protease inhibitor
MKQIVEILYYKNDKNFIIKLIPADKEHEIVLFKTEKKYGTMAEMAAATDSLIQLGKKERTVASKKWKYQFLSDDVVMVPDIDFDISASFDKLVGNLFEANTKTYKILKAWQRTAFKLDEAGAEVKSEAEFEVVLLSIEQEEETKPTPKKMIFDKPFFVMLRRTDAKNPYFCLYVANPELLVRE